MFNRLSEISSTPEDIRSFNPDATLPLPTQKVGIEIEMEEVERDTLKTLAATGFWQVKSDTSLRGNSGELVSVPLFGSDLRQALSDVTNVFRRTKKPTFNRRTSLHIHMDVMDMSPQELIRFFLLYCAFERTLFTLCDETRQNNPYCLPVWRSENTKQEMALIIEGIEDGSKRATQMLLSRWAKYNALNLNNITGIGTVEFRHMHGTINATEITQWIMMLMSIKKFAKTQMKSYNDFPEIVSGFLPQDYLGAVFTDAAIVERLQSPQLADDLLRGVRCAQDILMYRRLSRATHAIYGKQSGKETSSFNRLMKADINEPVLRKHQRKTKVLLDDTTATAATFNVTDPFGVGG
jgi:hypothetical protein